MRKNYSIVDLVRFAKLSQERVGEKPIDLLREYNKKFPELTVRKKYENLLRALGVEKEIELERVLAERLYERGKCNKHSVRNPGCEHENMERISENHFRCVRCGVIKWFGQPGFITGTNTN